MDEEEVGGDHEEGGGEGEGEEEKAASAAVGSRKEKRKEKKKMKRKQMRRQAAVIEREEEERRMNDPEEQRRVKEAEEAEREAVERAQKEFQEAERVWLEEMEKKRREEEEEERRRAVEEEEKRRLQVEMGNQCDKDDDWEYAEEGPAEIIWQGNEIIVRKKKVRVPKKNGNQQNKEEDANRPTSNPLPPQSEVFAEHQNASSAQQILENVAQQVPNFGTEQDKAHCPFHLKTGACRFGQRCSRVHFYPDKACTLLIKNMYNGPGIAWEQDEGLEYTDEEVDQCYEEFYEDVHTEFLKYGELVNFKVCKNGSFHLRGNVYVHYKSLDSAVLAYHSINGRYFAGKQVKCEFVNVTRWKIAICGEFMKSRLKTCSHGMACNFIHCFRNPGGDYEWADWDKPPPRYWVKKMAALFGYSAESEYKRQMEYEKSKSISKRRTIDTERHRARSKSQDIDRLIRRPSRSSVAEDDVQETTRHRRYTNDSRKRSKVPDDKSRKENSKSKDYHHGESRRCESESDEGWLRRDVHAGRERHRHHGHTRKRSKYSNKVSEDSTDFGENRSGTSLSDSAEWSDGGRKGQARQNHNLSNSAEVASLDDGVRADGNKLDRDRERRTLSSRLDRSSSHRSEASKTIDAGTSPDDGYYSGKSRQKHRHHVKKCSGNQESNKCLNDQFDDRNRRHGSDRDKEKHHSYKRKRSRGSPEISNEGGATCKRLKENSNNDRSEIEKSQHRRKSYDSDSSTEETVGQDRWEAESPGRWGDIRSEPLSSDEDYHNNEKMDRVGLGKSTSWDRNSAGFYADSKSRGCNDRRNNNRPNHDEIVTASPKEPDEGDDENNKIRHSKHKSRSYK